MINWIKSQLNKRMSKKISELPQATPLVGSELFAIVQNGSTKKTSVSALSGLTVESLATTNGSSSAAAGKLGEYVEVGPTISVALTSTVTMNIASIVLTPGDWDINAYVDFSFISSTCTSKQASISNTSNTQNGSILYLNTNETTHMFTNETATIPPIRALISATTTYYCVVGVSFAGGDAGASARMVARRVR
jgi:hypothetical protein